MWVTITPGGNKMSSSLHLVPMSCRDFLCVVAVLDGHPHLVVGKMSLGCMKLFQHHPGLNRASLPVNKLPWCHKMFTLTNAVKALWA